MKFNLTTTDIAKLRTDCMIVGIYEKAELTPAATKLNEMSQGHLEQIMQHDDFQGKIGQSLLLYQVPYLHTSRVLLVGCGKHKPCAISDYKKIILCSLKTLAST